MPLPKLSNVIRGELKCASCGEKFHEVTVDYRIDSEPTGLMFTLLPRYGPFGENWQSFPETEDVVGDVLACPGCGNVYENIHGLIFWYKVKRGGELEPVGRGIKAFKSIWGEQKVKTRIIGERRSVGILRSKHGRASK